MKRKFHGIKKASGLTKRYRDYKKVTEVFYHPKYDEVWAVQDVPYDLPYRKYYNGIISFTTGSHFSMKDIREHFLLMLEEQEKEKKNEKIHCRIHC